MFYHASPPDSEDDITYLIREDTVKPTIFGTLPSTYSGRISLNFWDFLADFGFYAALFLSNVCFPKLRERMVFLKGFYRHLQGHCIEAFGIIREW